MVPRSPCSDDPASLVWDCNGTNYGRMNRADATGQNGTVQLVASGSRPGGRPFALQFVAVPVDKYRIMPFFEELFVCFLMVPVGGCSLWAMPEDLCQINIGLLKCCCMVLPPAAAWLCA